MLANASQVLVRNAELFSEGRWLLVNPPEGHIFKQLDAELLEGFHQYFDIYQQSVKLTSEENQTFSAVFETPNQFDGAVVYMPKAKQHAKMLLANIAALVKPGGQLMLVGENKEGIKSAAKLLEPYGARVNKLDSARHCSLFCTQVNDHVAPFNMNDWQQTFTIKAGSLAYPIVSLPGVFSHGELDMGTALLLEQDYSQPGRTILDFACGAGVIGIYLSLKYNPTSVTMSDINALGLYCAEKSCELNEVKASIVASNGLAEINQKFDGVFTNPPFHTGVKTNYSVTESFISQVKQHLNPGGQLILVANRFLKYPQIIEDAMGNVATIAQTNKFNLYKSKKTH